MAETKATEIKATLPGGKELEFPHLTGMAPQCWTSAQVSLRESRKWLTHDFRLDVAVR